MQSLILQEIQAVRMDLLANQIRKRTHTQKKKVYAFPYLWCMHTFLAVLASAKHAYSSFF